MLVLTGDHALGSGSISERTLYNADATVRVPTLLAFLETQATLIASGEG
jgi:hypothetical protein